MTRMEHKVGAMTVDITGTMKMRMTSKVVKGKISLDHIVMVSRPLFFPTSFFSSIKTSQYPMWPIKRFTEFCSLTLIFFILEPARSIFSLSLSLAFFLYLSLSLLIYLSLSLPSSLANSLSLFSSLCSFWILLQRTLTPETLTQNELDDASFLSHEIIQRLVNDILKEGLPIPVHPLFKLKSPKVRYSTPPKFLALPEKN